jgi:tetraprenyl-beta-curcumene synthase
VTVSALDDRRLVARAALALVLANARYWTSVAPIVRRELRRWERRAQAIEDPELRALALDKLHSEGFHAEAASMLATLAPRAHRGSVVEAIVALELLFDYLDGLTERPSADPLGDGERAFRTLVDAVATAPARPGEDLELLEDDEGGYPEILSRTVALAIARLPAAAAIADIAKRTAEQAAQAQIRMHAVPQLAIGQLEEWAMAEAEPTRLEWRELVAGAASSVLVLHALITAAADPRTTSEAAARLAEAYLSICVVLTLLDGLVDLEQDTAHDDRPGYLSLFEARTEIPDVLGVAARRAARQARALPAGPYHVMILVGVIAYYGSAPGAQNDVAVPATARLRQELSPLISPTLAIMLAWRRTRRRARSSGAKREGGS